MENKTDYKTLVFEGASTKLYSYIGAIYYLKETNVLDKIENFIGTSSGSIICLLLSLNYSPEEIKELIFKVDTDKYGGNICIVLGLYNISKTYGYINTDKYLDWIKTVIRKKSGKENLTFKELYQLTNKNLVITGTCLNKRESHFYTRFSNPNMPIFKAIEISTALPFLFPPIKWGEDLLVDGGILENFPIYYIKEDGTFPNTRKEVVKYKANNNCHKINESVLGIKVTSLAEKKDNFNDDINSIAKFGLSIFNTLITQIERTSIKRGYYNNVIDIILDNNIDNFELKLTESKKQELFNLGYSFTQKFLEK